MANVLIGKVLKPQGIKGEVKVKAYTNDLDRFLRYSYFIIDGEKKKLVKSRKDSAFVYVLFESFMDMNKAETLRDKDLFVDSADMPKLNESEYYLSDLIGSEIISQNGSKLGEIVDVVDETRNAVVYAKINDKNASFPLVNKIIASFDREKKLFVVYEDKLNEVILFED